MDCTVCGEQISEARRKAMPITALCIKCASENDVPRIKRFDDHAVGDVTTETFFTDDNSYMTDAVKRVMSKPLSFLDEEYPEEQVALASTAEIDYSEKEEE